MNAGIKGNTNLNPAHMQFCNRAYITAAASFCSGFRALIKAVVLKQSKDQPNQFSGS